MIMVLSEMLLLTYLLNSLNKTDLSDPEQQDYITDKTVLFHLKAGEGRWRNLRRNCDKRPSQTD